MNPGHTLRAHTVRISGPLGPSMLAEAKRQVPKGLDALLRDLSGLPAPEDNSVTVTFDIVARIDMPEPFPASFDDDEDEDDECVCGLLRSACGYR